MADQQQKQQNYWAAVNGLSTVAQAENPTGLASGANSSSGALAGLSEANTKAEEAGGFNQFVSALGSGLGKGLGSFATGGLADKLNWGNNS